MEIPVISPLCLGLHGWQWGNGWKQALGRELEAAMRLTGTRSCAREPGAGSSLSVMSLPALVTGERAQLRFLEFCTANIRTPNTRRAYARAVIDRSAATGSSGKIAGLAALSFHLQVRNAAPVQPARVVAAPSWRRS